MERGTGNFLSLVLLVAATVLFVVACFTFRRKPSWLMAAGSACFAGAFVAGRVLD